MYNDEITVTYRGIGFDGLLLLLGIIFCILEGAGAINWGWVLCTIPFMIMAGKIILIIILYILAYIYD